MNELNRIITLTCLTGLLTVALFGFTLLNKDKFNGRVAEENIGWCGTASLENDRASKKYLLENDALALQGELLFIQNCKVCHRLDQKLIGPALRNVYSSRDSLWLTKMIVDGPALIKKKDKIAVALYKEYNETARPSFTIFTVDDVTALMRYLRAMDPKASSHPL